MDSAGSSSDRHIGILGGSFNPVHIGHIMLADYIAQFTDVDEVWLMLSPANPLKVNPQELLPDNLRMRMLQSAVEANPRLQACDVELSMPRPSYTIDSLSRLQELHPSYRFSLIIGSDNWEIFDRWRRHSDIVDCFTPIIYPRPGHPVDPAALPTGVRLVEAPMVDISSTFIRRAIASGKDMSSFLPPAVAQIISSKHLYQKS